MAVIGPEIALTNVRIVDGTGAPAVEDQTILIRDGRIVAIDDAGSVPMSMDTEVVNLAGHTVIPGLVGVHDHSYYTTSVRAVQMSYTGPRLYLAAGVTTIRTTGSQEPYAEINLKRAIDDALFMRGSRDFADLPGYRRFIDVVVGRINARNAKRIDLERACLKPLPPRHKTDYDAQQIIRRSRGPRHLIGRVRAA